MKMKPIQIETQHIEMETNRSVLKSRKGKIWAWSLAVVAGNALARVAGVDTPDDLNTTVLALAGFAVTGQAVVDSVVAFRRPPPPPPPVEK